MRCVLQFYTKDECIFESELHATYPVLSTSKELQDPDCTFASCNSQTRSDILWCGLSDSGFNLYISEDNAAPTGSCKLAL